ncbi:sulfur oxidation c-type cytochrome SoxX [Paralcaligenes ginsengisoli]
MKKSKFAPFAAMIALSAASISAMAAEHAVKVDHKALVAELKSSFSEKGTAKLDRLDQSPMQQVCSQAGLSGKPLTKEQAAAITKEALASIKAPADGQYLGDWKAGEKIAQSGKGLQYTDKPGSSSGGNCYACHQMTKAEISYGNIGPSLLHYGTQRGNSKQVVEYTWNKVYNSHAYSACSVMPRFGAAGILTEAQLKDVMALLFDPKSPVNDDTAKP